MTSNGPVVQRIAGAAGNGILDPGEVFNDLNNDGAVDGGAGESDHGTIFDISSFVPDSRVSVEYAEGGTNVIHVAYLGKDDQQRETLYSTRIMTMPPAAGGGYTISSASRVIGVGDVVTGLPDPISDLEVHDAINSQGQIAVWLVSGSANAVLRADPVRTPLLLVPGIVGTMPVASEYNTTTGW